MPRQTHILDSNLRSLSESELRNVLAKCLDSIPLVAIDRRNLLYNFFSELFRQERIVRVSDIIKSNLIPIESPNVNRAFQISLLSTLDLFSNKLGIKKIPVDQLLDVSWNACVGVYPYFQENKRIAPEEIRQYLADFGDQASNDSIVLKTPVFLLSTSNAENQFLKKAAEICEKTTTLMDKNPQPAFLQKRLDEMEKLVCELQKYLLKSGGTEFVYTGGRKERLIYDKIENMVLESERCFRMMMAYMSEETKILYGLVDKLKLFKDFQARMLVRFEPKTERHQPNTRAIKDLKEAIGRKADSASQRDEMLKRLNIKYFNADPSKFFGLHAKMFICDESSVMATSANLLPTSLESNVEAGFYSEDPYLVKDGINFFERVWAQC